MDGIWVASVCVCAVPIETIKTIRTHNNIFHFPRAKATPDPTPSKDTLGMTTTADSLGLIACALSGRRVRGGLRRRQLKIMTFVALAHMRQRLCTMENVFRGRKCNEQLEIIKLFENATESGGKWFLAWPKRIWNALTIILNKFKLFPDMVLAEIADFFLEICK